MDESRKAFESWIKFHSDEDETNGKLEKANSGSNYADSTTDICWLAWQSSRAAIEIEMPDIYQYLAEVNDETLSLAFCLLAEGVRKGDIAAIRAAGIKVKE